MKTHWDAIKDENYIKNGKINSGMLFHSVLRGHRSPFKFWIPCKFKSTQKNILRPPLTQFKMGFFGAARRQEGEIGGAKSHPSIKSVTHILQSWNLAVIPYLKNVQKIYESRDTPLEFCWHWLFSPEISNFYYIKKYRYRLQFDT